MYHRHLTKWLSAGLTCLILCGLAMAPAGASSASARRTSLVRKLLLLLLLLSSVSGVVGPAAGVRAASAAPDAFTFPLIETFKGTSASGWVLGGTSVLTNESGNGWLRLTSAATYQAGYAYYNTPIPTGRGMIITFDYGAWGGTGADGLSFWLFDGATTTFKVGANGGSLGYAQKSGINGLSGGYLGLGLDEFGNYSNPNEGRVGGPGVTPQSVAMRGPGTGTTGYAYLTGTTRLTASPWSLPKLDCSKNFTGLTNIGVTNGVCGTDGVTRPAATTYSRQVKITLTPVGSAYQATVAVRYGPDESSWRTLLGPYTMPTSAPSTLKMGFAASTGGNTNYHEIRNLTVTQQVPDLTATKAVQNATTGGGSVAPGDQLLYTVILRNNTGAALSDVSFSDPIPTNTTYVADSAAVPVGSTLTGISPLSVTGITMPANGQATITFKVQVDNPLAGGVTLISNQGSFTYGSGPTTSQTDGDAVTDGNQPTTIGVTAGANFDTSTKTVTYEDLDSSGAVSPGDRLTYHVILPNTGNQNSPAMTFTDVLPTNMTYVTSPGATASSGVVSYSSTAKTLTWTGSVNAGSQVTIDFKVTVNSGVKIRDVISNQGTLTGGASPVLTDADLTTPGKQPTQLLVGGVATLTATKTAEVVGGGSPGASSQVRYTILLNNTGLYAVSGATFADSIPANTTYVSADTSSGTIAATSPTLSITGINLASGAQATIHLTVQIASALPTGSTQIINQGTVSWDANQSGANNTSLATDSDPVTAGQQPTVLTVTGSPQGMAVKSVTDENGGNLAPGDTLLYTIVMQNQSGYAANGIQFVDAIPANTTFVTTVSTPSGSTVASTTPTLDITGINVPANSQVSLSFRVQVNNPLAGGVIEISNQGTVWYDSDGNGSNDASQQTDGNTALSGEQATIIPVTAGPNFNETTKSVALQTDADGNGAVSPGDKLRYTVVIQNTGNQNASGVTFADPLPGITTYVAGSVTATSGAPAYSAGSISWSGDVNAGSSATITFDVTVNSGITTGTVISNQGTVTNGGTTVATDGDTNQPGDQPTTVTTGGSPQGVAIKSVTDENGGNLQPGDILRYTIVMQNQSGYNANGLQFVDPIPANTTYVAASLSAPAGSTIVSETPTVDITGINVPAHSQVSLSFRVRVDNPLAGGVIEISNQGTVYYDSDGNGSNDASQQTDGDTTLDGDQITSIPVTAGPNFNETTKSVALRTDADGNGAVSPGDKLRYTVVIQNTGNQNALGVTFADPLPGITTYVAGSVTATSGAPAYSAGSISWSGDVNAGSSATITFDVTVNSGITTGTVISNQGTVTYAGATVATDGDTSEPGDQPTVVTVGGSPQGIALKSVTDENGGGLLPGDTLLYTIVMQNQSGLAAPGIAFMDSIPANTTYVAASATTTSGTASYTAPTLNVTGITVAASGGTATITFRVQVNNPLSGGVTQISNQGIVFYDSDGVGGNDATQQTDGDATQPGNQPTLIQVTPGADLVITKTGRPDPAPVGSNVTYNLAVSNAGSATASSLQVVDTLPAGVTFVSATGAEWSCGHSNGIVTCTRATLAVGDQSDITLVATVGAAAVSPIENNVTVTSATIELNAADNSDSATTPLVQGNFGHLPSAYVGMNLLEDGGAWAVTGATMLGARVTTATDGINNATYSTKVSDDGVTWTGAWTAGIGYATVNVTCPAASCYLYAWADWNRNQQFTADGIPETNEMIYGGVVQNGDNAINFRYAASGSLAAGTYYVRFRVYAQQPSNSQPYGAALDSAGTPIVGEIEDYAYTQIPLAVTLDAFTAQAQDGGVTVRWETVNERESLGFHLDRATSADGPWTRINPALIPSVSPGSPQGYAYAYVDRTAVWDRTYLYRLSSMDLAGVSEAVQTTQIDFAAPFHLWLPLLVR